MHAKDCNSTIGSHESPRQLEYFRDASLRATSACETSSFAEDGCALQAEMVLNALAVYRDPPYTYLLFMKRSGVERRNKQSEQRVRWEVALSDDDDDGDVEGTDEREKKVDPFFADAYLFSKRLSRVRDLSTVKGRYFTEAFSFFFFPLPFSFIFFVHLALKPSVQA